MECEASERVIHVVCLGVSLVLGSIALALLVLATA